MSELIRTVAEHPIATVLLTLCFTGCVYVLLEALASFIVAANGKE